MRNVGFRNDLIINASIELQPFLFDISILCCPNVNQRGFVRSEVFSYKLKPSLRPLRGETKLQSLGSVV